MSFDLSRRTALRGMFRGSAVAVALPFLDCFLDGNGQAIAATGAPLPVRFGTWFWGLGCNPKRWFPTKEGAGYDLPDELSPIGAYKEKINVLGGFDMPLDGQPSFPHFSGHIGLRTGIAAAVNSGLPGPTLDVLIGDKIGSSARFRSIELSVSGDARNSLSGRGNGNINPAETSVAALYTRIFGPEFKDPNSATFAPDPALLARRSVLSAITEQRQNLFSRLGVTDRRRMDQYFTALRAVEQQLDVQLTKPQPLEACVVPEAPKERPTNAEIENVVQNHKLMADLLAMALACDQTRVFNLTFNAPASTLTRIGSTTTHHQLTHEEPIDTNLGYQPQATYFINQIMQGWAYFVGAMDRIKEGDGTLLDHCLIFAHTETEVAKFHTIDNMPMMIAGSAGGRIKTGLHINGKNTPATRVGLTLQQVMGVSINKWGRGSLETDKSISELMA